HKAENQTVAEMASGVGAFFYVRGVLDATWSTVLKALLQEGIVKSSKNSNDPKMKLPSELLNGMHSSNSYFAPLWKTDYFSANLKSDQYLQLVSNYLDKH